MCWIESFSLSLSLSFSRFLLFSLVLSMDTRTIWHDDRREYTERERGREREKACLHQLDLSPPWQNSLSDSGQCFPFKNEYIRLVRSDRTATSLSLILIPWNILLFHWLRFHIDCRSLANYRFVIINQCNLPMIHQMLIILRALPFDIRVYLVYLFLNWYQPTKKY